MLHSLFKGTKNSSKTGNTDDTSVSSSSRSSQRSGHHGSTEGNRRLVRSKNIRGLRCSGDDFSADASRSSLLSIDRSSEAVTGTTCGSLSLPPSSPIFQCPINADTYLPLPTPVSLKNFTLQESAQWSPPVLSPRSWNGDIRDSDGTSGGYGSDSASSDSSFESSASHGIFSVFTRQSEGDLQSLPGTHFGNSVGAAALQSFSPGYRNGQGQGGGLHIRTQVDGAPKSAPNSRFTSPVSSPRAWGPRDSQWLWNSTSDYLQQPTSSEFLLQQTRPNMDVSLMAQNKMVSPRHPLSNGKSYDKLPWTDAHPLPLPPTLGTAPASPSSSLLSPRSPKGSPWGSSKLEAGAPTGKWQKGRLLGSGAFGKVYKGIHSETGEFCAIKEVEYVQDDPRSKESAKQLAQEIMLLSSLRHPNIVHYKGSELVDGFLNIYLELVSGGSIYKLYQEFKKLEEPVIRRYTRQILHGLHFLHSKNTVHRDIKGANILVDQEGIVKLADFGMAKQIQEQGAAFLSFKGSPYWMAPEVIMQKNTGFEFAIDIWSLGCTVLEMVTGKPPWSEYEGVAAMFKVTRAEVPPIPNSLSSDGQSFIRLCLQRNPADRPSAAALLEHPFVQFRNNGPDFTMPAINVSDFLSYDAEERSTLHENEHRSNGLLRGGSQPSNNSHYSQARARTGMCPSRSAPVSPRSAHNDMSELAAFSSAGPPPGFSTPQAGSPRRGREFDYYADLRKSSNVPRNHKSRNNGFYRTEDAELSRKWTRKQLYQEEGQDYSTRKPYRTQQKMDEKATRMLLERLPY